MTLLLNFCQLRDGTPVPKISLIVLLKFPFRKGESDISSRIQVIKLCGTESTDFPFVGLLVTIYVAKYHNGYTTYYTKRRITGTKSSMAEYILARK